MCGFYHTNFWVEWVYPWQKVIKEGKTHVTANSPIKALLYDRWFVMISVTFSFIRMNVLLVLQMIVGAQDSIVVRDDLVTCIKQGRSCVCRGWDPRFERNQLAHINIFTTMAQTDQVLCSKILRWSYGHILQWEKL